MNQMMTCLFLLVVALLCGTLASAESVDGRVVDSCNHGVSNVMVYIGDNRALSDHNGNFGMWLDPGVYHNIHVQGKTVTAIDSSGTIQVNVPIGQELFIIIQIE